MLNCQKHLFDFEEGITYLNGAYMSPMLRSVEQAGLTALVKKAKPWNISTASFFDGVETLKGRVTTLLQHDQPERIAIIPSVSYGMANAARNITFKKGDHILLLDKQFPSNYFIWHTVAAQHAAIIDIASPPVHSVHRGQDWNARVLELITPQTRVVSMEHVHWADGTVFDLAAIRQKTKEVGALLILDLTQSLGAYPIDQSSLQADAIIAAAYKFLMGPYAMGVAYYGPAFDAGIPIEENWINKRGSEVFEKLLDYEPEYKPGAARYSMGEQSQFIHIPMQIAAIEQILAWGVPAVQAYCKSLVDSILPWLNEQKIWIEEEQFRANHLFGIRPSGGITNALKSKLVSNQVYVSYRSDTIRVSPNVYNTKEDLQKLVSLLVD